jgi:hypothetical protein
MTRQDYLMIARAISRAKKKKLPTYLIADQIEMEIVAGILAEDKTLDYRWFYRECNK